MSTVPRLLVLECGCKRSRAIYHTLERLNPGDEMVYLRTIFALIACKEASLFGILSPRVLIPNRRA